MKVASSEAGRPQLLLGDFLFVVVGVDDEEPFTFRVKGFDHSVIPLHLAMVIESLLHRAAGPLGVVGLRSPGVRQLEVYSQANIMGFLPS